MLFLVAVVVGVVLAVTLSIQNFQLRQEVLQINSDVVEDLRYASECSEKATHLLDTAPQLALVEVARALELLRVMHSRYGRKKIVELAESKEGDFYKFVRMLDDQKQAALTSLSSKKRTSL